jgi:hypothetical protein
MQFFKKLTQTTLIFLLLIPQGFAEESQLVKDLRDTIKKAFVVVENKLFPNKPDIKPDKPVVPVKCECNGTGYITHGDGHKTPCPDYPGCTKGAGQKPVEIKPVVKPVLKNAVIEVYSSERCPPCALFKRQMLQSLRDNGWTVTVTEQPMGYPTPTFKVWVNGQNELFTGYSGKESFVATVNSIVSKLKR